MRVRTNGTIRAKLTENPECFLEEVEGTVLVPAGQPGDPATPTEYAATSPAPNHESGRIAQRRSQYGGPSNSSEAEVPLEGEGGRNDEGGLGGEEQPYDQGCFEHRHPTHEPRPV